MRRLIPAVFGEAATASEGKAAAGERRPGRDAPSQELEN